MKYLKFLSPIILLVTVNLLIASNFNKQEKPLGASVLSLATEYNKSEITSKYQLSGAILKTIPKDDPKDRIEVSVGNESNGLLGAAGDFEPILNIKRWDNEVSLSIKKDVSKVAAKDKKVSFKGDKIIYDTPKEEYNFYEVADSTTTPEGGYEFEVILKEKPITNIVSFNIETKGLDFFYTPIEYDAEEIKDGAFRPEEVKGSYAVYYKNNKSGDYSNVGGKNYRAGKFGHIYRPLIKDINGNKTWGELSIKNGILSIIINQQWLDAAAYPVIVDPTFGNTAVGGTSSTWADNNMRGWEYTTTGEGSVYGVFIYKSGTGIPNLRGIVYRVSDDARITFGAETTDSIITKHWSYSPVTRATLSTSTAYKIGVWIQDTATSPIFYYDAGVTQYRDNTVYHSTNNPPATFTENSSTVDRKASIYAAFSVTAGTGTDTFANYGTYSWVVPTGVTSINVACWGGGGGGSVDSVNGGHGGGGGAYAAITNFAVTPGDSYSVVVGKGINYNEVGPASSSSFNINSVIAVGGDRGYVGGPGGLAASSTGDIKYDGGNGGNGETLNSTCGGGGGAGGPDGAGNNGYNATATTGGSGGSGDAGAGGAGGAGGNGGQGGSGGGSIKGGGGGGGGATTFDGALGGYYGGGGGGSAGQGTYVLGADGAVAITYTIGGGASTPPANIINFE